MNAPAPPDLHQLAAQVRARSWVTDGVMLAALVPGLPLPVEPAQVHPYGWGIHGRPDADRAGPFVEFMLAQDYPVELLFQQERLYSVAGVELAMLVRKDKRAGRVWLSAAYLPVLQAAKTVHWTGRPPELDCPTQYSTLSVRLEEDGPLVAFLAPFSPASAPVAGRHLRQL